VGLAAEHRGQMGRDVLDESLFVLEVPGGWFRFGW
jgi:hypothetical protein